MKHDPTIVELQMPTIKPIISVTARMPPRFDLLEII